MDKHFEEKFHRTEEWNWWFVARRHSIKDLLKNIPKSAKLLDIGCAGGPLLSELKELGFENATGIDISDDAITKCKQRGLEVFKMDAQNLQFEENSYDVIIASDSLEHLQFDEQALKNWFHVLKPGGKIFVFVPAYYFLWSEHDVIHHHYKRYTKNVLVSKIKNEGFAIERAGYWNFAMFFPATVFRLLQRLKNKIAPSKNSPKDQLVGTSSVTNKFLIKWMSFENRIFQSTPFPFGITVFAEATKPIK